MTVMLTMLIALLAVAASAAPPPRFLNERHAYVRGEKATLRLTVHPGTAPVAFDVSGWLPERVRGLKMPW